MILLIFVCVLSYIHAETTNDAYKDQYGSTDCTDPRTMKKHAAYTEWADAYSCTRHRCQPGGRNLAIYTVGCKRVEAPESAIECEEVVEDTNMQFPYCCTRLRCLVVVRGEVWTRVLGQPWETLPAAPWSHMYKMKKPPPGNEFLPKNANEGPVYELNESDNEKPREKVLRASKQQGPRTAETPDPNCNDVVPRAAPTPDIVIALTTNNDQKELNKQADKDSRKHRSKTQAQNQYYDDENRNDEAPNEPEEQATEKPTREGDPSEESRDYYYPYGVTQKPKTHHRSSWTEIPPNQWNEPDNKFEVNIDPAEISLKQQQQMPQYQDSFHQDNFHQDHQSPEVEKKSDKPGNLQALVDAIGTRMRDIENVVQRMSEKVHQGKPGEEPELSQEKSTALHESDISLHNKDARVKRPSPEGDQYKRFSVRSRGSSKYLHGGLESTSEAPVFVEDNANANGYFSDASNSVLRRSNPRIEPKEPAPTYMAPVDNRRKAHPSPSSDEKQDKGKKHRKRAHKKKRRGGKPHKKHHKDDKKRRFNRLNSVENDRILISLEDSSAVNNN